MTREPEVDTNEHRSGARGFECGVDEQGVDLTLVRYTLSLTPTQRLQAVEDFMNTLLSTRVIRRACDGGEP